MVDVRVTAYGAAALSALASVVGEAKRTDPLAPVTVIAPTHTAGTTARRYLARGLANRCGVAGLQVFTANELASRLARGLPGALRRLGREAVFAAWRSVLAADPGVFGPVADHAATVRAVVGAYGALREADAATLDAVAAGGELPAHLVRLHREVRDRLASRFDDARSIADRVADAVAQGAINIAALGVVVVYLPQDLPASQRRMVASVVTRVPAVVIAGMTGVARADRGVVHTVEQLGADASGLRGRTNATLVRPVASRVWHTSDSDDETRVVARAVSAVVQDHPGHRVAVLYTAAAPYARQLRDRFAAAGLRVAGPAAVPLSETAVAHGFLGLIRLAGWPIRRSDLFDVLAAAQIIEPVNGARVPTQRWERITRKAGVVAGPDWDERISHYTADLQRRLADLPEPERADHYWQREVAEASALRGFVARLSAILAEQPRTWPELAEWAQRIYSYVSSASTEPRERAAADQIGAFLSQAEYLAGVESVASVESLIETIGDLLASAPLEGPIGSGVWIAPVSSAIGLDADEVFVVGLAEDMMPGRRGVDPLLPDQLRQVAGLESSREWWGTQQRWLLAAFAAGARVTASFPRGDLRGGGERFPSQWLLPSIRELAGDNALSATESLNVRAEGLGWAPSHSAALLRPVEIGDLPRRPATEQEWRLRALAAPSVGHRALEDPVLDAAQAMIKARSGEAFTRFDGNLSGAGGMPDFASMPVSPTSLEEYSKCPHAYFVRRMLRVEPLTQPEQTVAISPLDKGTLLHECMDKLITEFGQEGRTPCLPRGGEPWTAKQRQRMIEIFDDVADEAERSGLTGHRTLWARDRDQMSRQVLTMLDEDNKWRATRGASVVASELAFGTDSADPAVIMLPSGGQVLLKGSADKIDQAADGTILVTDIKTGSARSFEGLGESNPTLAGTKLQLPAYAHVARARFGTPDSRVEALYWFTRSGQPRVELPLTPAVEAAYAQTLDTLTASIAAGLFPAKPPEHDDFSWVQCPYCNPDGVGYRDARSGWQRHRDDPCLTDLVALIDGVDADDATYAGGDER